jgi:hypothetical protein
MDQDPGSRAFLAPISGIGIWDGKSPYPGPGINMPDHILESLGAFFCSAEDPGCLSRILIFVFPDLGSKNNNKEKGEKNYCPSFFCSHKKRSRSKVKKAPDPGSGSANTDCLLKIH